MANEASNYCGGRGLPPYLLCRFNSDSTDYSDGASGIFLSSIPTISTRGSTQADKTLEKTRLNMFTFRNNPFQRNFTVKTALLRSFETLWNTLSCR